MHSFEKVQPEVSRVEFERKGYQTNPMLPRSLPLSHALRGMIGNPIYLNWETGPFSTVHVKGSTKCQCKLSCSQKQPGTV